mmetsp:Transcript_41243/g.162676  ORF Transcript_41243/g.162676 Transcript_41243/m.162676 type:complete len:263 (+) Transcript_41243:146-934(+)
MSKIQTFFLFHFHTYQYKPYSWLHFIFIIKIFSYYLWIFFYAITPTFNGIIKFFIAIKVLSTLFSTLCLANQVWGHIDILIIASLSSVYLSMYYKTELNLIASPHTSTRVSCLSHFMPNDYVNLSFLQANLSFISLYAYTLLYLLLSKILLATITAEELVTLVPVSYIPQLNKVFNEFKINILLSVQLFNLNYSNQKQLWKLIRNRRISKIISLLQSLFILQLYFSNNVIQTQNLSTLLYSRNKNHIVISFTTVRINTLLPQ